MSVSGNLVLTWFALKLRPISCLAAAQGPAFCNPLLLCTLLAGRALSCALEELYGGFNYCIPPRLQSVITLQSVLQFIVRVRVFQVKPPPGAVLWAVYMFAPVSHQPLIKSPFRCLPREGGKNEIKFPCKMPKYISHRGIKDFTDLDNASYSTTI